MKKNVKLKNIFLINLIKVKNEEQFKKPININNESKRKDKFLLKELTYLANSSLYIRELERLEKINKENLMRQSMKIQKKKKINIKYLIQMHNIMKGSCNKMFLDLIYNNPKTKKNFFSLTKTNDNKYKTKLKIESNKLNPYSKYNLEKCHTDSINLISNRNSLKNIKKSLSFYSQRNHYLFKKKKFSIAKSLSSEKMNNFYNSESNLNRNRQMEKIDEVKGMLSINYNIHKNLINNITKRYSHNKFRNNIKL